MTKQKSMISVDFWDTLVDAAVGGKTRRQIRHDALCKVSEGYVGKLDASRIEAASSEASEEFTRIWFNQQRTPGSKELIDRILVNLGIPATKLDMDFLVQEFEESLMEGQPAVLEGAKESIRSLASQYRLTLISDTMYSPGRVIRRFLDEHGLLEYFDSFLFSDEAGFSKPNPKAFRKMLEDTGCEPGHSYHIGDRLNTDIAGAKEVGMKAILFTGVSMKANRSESEAKPDYRCDSWQEINELLL